MTGAARAVRVTALRSLVGIPAERGEAVAASGPVPSQHRGGTAYLFPGPGRAWLTTSHALQKVVLALDFFHSQPKYSRTRPLAACAPAKGVPVNSAGPTSPLPGQQGGSRSQTDSRWWPSC